VPLVLSATPQTLEEARRLGVTGCLENAILAGLGNGVQARGRGIGEIGRVAIGGGFVVDVERVRTPSGRRAWRPIAVGRIGAQR
jgi:hypothetical protein